MRNYIFVTLLSIICLNSFGQISAKDNKTIEKAKSYFDKGQAYNAVDKLKPVLDNNKAECYLWDLMIKFQFKRYEDVLKVDGNSLIDQTRVAVRGIYYKDLVTLLVEAEKNCENIENLCEKLQNLMEYGNEKSFETKNEKTYYELYKLDIDNLRNKRCTH